MLTKINVIIPVFKPDNKLIQIFDMLEKQTLPVSKIILMNTVNVSCSDVVNPIDMQGQEIISQCEKRGIIPTTVVEVSPQFFDHGGTRAKGANYADEDAEYLLYMTQDAVPADDKLTEELVNAFIFQNNVAVSYGRQLPSKESSLAEVFTRGFNYPDSDAIKTVADIETIGIKAFFCSNVCAMYKKSIYDELGGFIRKTIFNEDMIFANKILKNGYTICYASKAKVYHTHNYSGKQQYKRNFDLAVSQTLNPQAFEGISSESEGIKYVKAAFVFFLKKGKPWLIIPFGINCVYKLAGYRKGKRIAELSLKEVMKCTSNQGFFNDISVGSDIVERVLRMNGIEYKK